MLKKNQAMKLILLAGALSFPVTGMAEQMPNQPRTSISQQNGKVTGTVEDALGTVIGATVVVKGTTNGTTTDIDGRFTLEGVKKGSILQISFVGYTTKEVKYTGQSVLKIMLQEDTKTLDEVVVVGFGTQKKVNLTGSVGTVDSEALASRPVQNAVQALQGVVPGLQITTTSGALDNKMSMSIRGTGTIGDGSDASPVPCVPVDELELPAYYDSSQQTIFVKKGLSEEVLFVSMAKEVSAAVYDFKHNESRDASDFKSFCVAYMVSSRYGVDTRGFDFSRLPREYAEMDTQAFKGELGTMRDVLGEIQSDMYKSMEKNKPAKSKEQER